MFNFWYQLFSFLTFSSLKVVIQLVLSDNGWTCSSSLMFFHEVENYGADVFLSFSWLFLLLTLHFLLHWKLLAVNSSFSCYQYILWVSVFSRPSLHVIYPRNSSCYFLYIKYTFLCNSCFSQNFPSLTYSVLGILSICGWNRITVSSFSFLWKLFSIRCCIID